MADLRFDRPCIHIVLLPEADKTLYRWAEIGAEEEGVPCRQVEYSGGDVLAEAYAAAHSSRFQVGVSISAQAVILHELHMPPKQPVLTFALNGQAAHACRVMGANAARMVIHKPLRTDLSVPTVPPPPQRMVQPASLPKPSLPATASVEEPLDAEFVKRVIATVVHILQERGVA